ncbi:MAG: hypothetical protein GWM98_02510 [Nitrospinaceae bacterium]|nr:hypothetical protein [Nitrospinaceae bacterium]NIR53577.1 hypothetical protein [Nitrospinaceae bacterium]NIS83978.1 hypothetical protein [Nitrospinaceae bacterium]NIT80787.1 hypothetical protein [Nitrospinaceae bacterium]NIU43093.1 hypothetical protein [Nitrospinaceae bacterium]
MEEAPHELGDSIDTWVGRLSLWISLLLATLATVIYCVQNPQDSEEVQRMRIFFRENGMAVTQFIKMPPEEMERFAANQEHPFFKTYIRASENEKKEINAQIHNSIDYRPAQYWFNVVFLWFIFFTTFWFLGLIGQGVVNLVRQNPSLK